jgi:hypothetical protein
MSGRALLNRVEYLMCEGLDEETRALTRWHLRDPDGFAAEQNSKKTTALLDAGGEMG